MSTPLSKDRVLDTLFTIPAEHKLINSGKMFSAGFVANSLADGETLDLIIQANSLHVSLRLDYAFSGNGHVHAYAVNSWTGGTALNVANNFTKYQGVNSIQATILTQPSSINDIGTERWSQFVPGGVKVQAIGASGGFGEHLILAGEDKMLIRLQNHSGSGATVGFDFNLYEIFPEII